MNETKKVEPAYHEIQRVRQAWIWGVVTVIAGLAWYALARQLLLRRPFGTTPIPDHALAVLWLIFGIGLPALFLLGRLVTEVRCDGIYIRFVPFHRSFRRIAFEDVKRCQVRTYHPLLEYGGWGIRIGLKGKAYNAYGNRGVQLELRSGRRLLIGSQRPEEFLRAIRGESGRRWSEGDCR